MKRKSMQRYTTEHARERYYAAQNALQAFCDGLESVEDKHDPQKYACLFDYIATWLEDGNGIRDCSEDFQIYLTTVALIIDWWNAGRVDDFDGVDDAILFIPRRIVEVMDWSRTSSRILDPSYFQFWRITYKEKQEHALELFIRERLPSKE